MKWKMNRKYKVMWVDEDSHLWGFIKGQIIEVINIECPCSFRRSTYESQHCRVRLRCNFSVTVPQGSQQGSKLAEICGWRVKILSEKDEE